jgi:hypothetical protein
MIRLDTLAFFLQEVEDIVIMLVKYVPGYVA